MRFTRRRATSPEFKQYKNKYVLNNAKYIVANRRESRSPPPQKAYIENAEILGMQKNHKK